MFGRPLEVIDATYCTLGNIILTHIPKITKKLAISEWAPGQQLQAIIQVAVPFALDK